MSKKGKIIVEFGTVKDLERIVERIVDKNLIGSEEVKLNNKKINEVTNLITSLHLNTVCQSAGVPIFMNVSVIKPQPL